MPPLNNFIFKLQDNIQYEFELDNYYPATSVIYKGIPLFRYIYTHRNNNFHMEVFMHHGIDNKVDMLHTFILDPIDFIPLISECKKELLGKPNKIIITKWNPKLYHTYNLEFLY
jgi:hypothetical protein